MKTALITAFLLTLNLPTPQCAEMETATSESPVVATVIGKKITAADIGLQYDANGKATIPISTPDACRPNSPVEKLQACVMREIARDYIAKKDLKATHDEIREFQDYQDRAMAQAHLGWQKQLAEAHKKLQRADLSAEERKQTEEERATLERLTTPDKRLEGNGQKLTPEELQGIFGPWIERWKFSRSVYDKYGGAVAVTKFGPDPVGAVKGLLGEYEKQGSLVIHDELLRTAFWTRLSEPPRFTAKPGEIDFTPHWKKPLPKDEE